jgi:hypothetical protein
MKRTLVLLLLLNPACAPVQGGEVEETHYLRSVEIAEGSRVPEVVCIGCSVHVRGIVDGDVVALGGDIEAGGTIQGDAVAVGGRVRLLSSATVNGDAVAVGGAVDRAGNATIRGDADAFPYFFMPGQRSFHPIGAAVFLTVNLSFILLGAAIFGRKRAANIADAVVRHPLLSGVIGTLLMAAWVVLWIMMDRNSLPIRVAAWSGHAIILVFLYCGALGLAWMVGRMCAPARPTPVQWLAGSVIWISLLMIPIVGALLWIAAMILALGAALVSRLGKNADWLSDCGRRARP